MTDILRQAKRLAKAGFSIIWLHERSKMPIQRRWTEKSTATVEDLERTYEDGYNVGVRLGKPSRISGYYLVAIDVDVRDDEYRAEAYRQVEKLLGIALEDFPTVISGSGGASRHLYALSETPHSSRKLWHSAEKMVGEDGKKHWCAEIELFGTGKQLVLPPSIHPDTGKAYKWADPFDVEELPILDEDRLAVLLGEDGDSEGDHEDAEPLGLTYTEGRDLLERLQDWANDRETWAQVGMALKHEYGERDGWRLFDAWSKRGSGYDKTENLVQWRSFGRSYKGRPVTMRTLIKEVKDRDIIEQLDDDSDEIVALFDDIDEEELAESTPPHLMSVPGVLGEIVDYYNRNSYLYHPELAVPTALALGSVVLGRHWITDSNNLSSLWIATVVKTGSGKEFGFRVIREALKAAGWDDDLIGAPNFTSTSALFGDLFARPRMISLTDEIGIYWKAARESANGLQTELRGTMLELWGRLDGVIKEKAYSQRGMSKEQIDALANRKIEYPALTIFGASTPKVFYEALSSQEIASGFLNRWLIIHSDRRVGSIRKPTGEKIPKKVVRWIKDNVRPIDSDDDTDFDMSHLRNPMTEPDLQEIPFSKKAWNHTMELHRVQREEMERLEKFGYDEVFSRARETAMRLSIIVARSCGSDVIKYEHIKWAGEYVFYHTRRTVQLLMKHMDRSPLDDAADRIAQVVREAGEEGVPVSKVWNIREWRNLPAHQRNDVLERLRHIHRIVEREISKSGRGRKRKVMIDIKHVKKADRE